MSQFFGGPLDGRRSADFPPDLAGKPFTGLVIRVPLSEPHYFSLFAVYVCKGDKQVNGCWQFFYERMEGPNGEHIDATQATTGGQQDRYGLPSAHRAPDDP